MAYIKKILQIIFPRKFILNRLNGSEGVVLSFDDGPHPVHTPLILDELSRRNIKAAFFATGSELEKYQDLGRRIVDEGHLLGNHTYDHLDVKKVRFSRYKKSLIRSEKIIEKVAGSERKKVFRPPYSSFSLRLLSFILFSNYSIFNWTIDSRDSYISNVHDLNNHLKGIDIKNGDILLFHEDYRHTVDSLPFILDQLEERSINIVL